jgi:hypothetical protein
MSPASLSRSEGSSFTVAIVWKAALSAGSAIAEIGTQSMIKQQCCGSGIFILDPNQETFSSRIRMLPRYRYIKRVAN